MDTLKLCKMDTEILQLLKQKRLMLRDSIVENTLDFLFLRRANTMLFE